MSSLRKAVGGGKWVGGVWGRHGPSETQNKSKKLSPAGELTSTVTSVSVSVCVLSMLIRVVGRGKAPANYRVAWCGI